MNSSCPHTESRMKQGWLWKKTGRLGSWERRLVVCANGIFSSAHSAMSVMTPSLSIPLLLAQVKPVDQEIRRNSFALITRERTIIFQASTRYEMEEWINVIQNSIFDCLNGDSGLETPPKARPKNDLPESHCADCGAIGAKWVLINRGIFLCDKCAGIHRALPSQMSTVRSTALDSLDKISIALLKSLGNKTTNDILEHNLTPNDRIGPNASFDERNLFIRKKYLERAFASSEEPPDPFIAIQNCDYHSLMKCAILGGLENAHDEGGITPLHAAVICGDPISVAIISQNLYIGPSKTPKQTQHLPLSQVQSEISFKGIAPTSSDLSSNVFEDVHAQSTPIIDIPSSNNSQNIQVQTTNSNMPNYLMSPSNINNQKFENEEIQKRSLLNIHHSRHHSKTIFKAKPPLFLPEPHNQNSSSNINGIS